MSAIIDSVRTYLMQFEGLQNGLFCVDYLGAEPTEYCVEAVPCDPVYQRYTDGSCLRQFLFIFASREFFSADVVQNTANAAFYEAFMDWIHESNEEGVLPDLDGHEPVSIEVLTSGYVFDAEADAARYQIQLRLIYE